MLAKSPLNQMESARAPDHGILGLVRNLIVRGFKSGLSGVRKVNRAHSQQLELANVPEHVLRDIGLSREEVAGVSAFQPDLPFFMQSGFGRH